MRKMIQRIGNMLCRKRLFRQLPGVEQRLKAYSAASGTTGTQWITLWMAVSGILKHRPEHILESGTGASTLVLAEAVRYLKARDASYRGKITSMESEEKWFEIAKRLLPSEYLEDVEIVFGPREKFEIGFFRGYSHSSIPTQDYSFVLLDGPKFWDERGVAFCADILKAMSLSKAPVIRGVVDGRASSVFVIQTLFGTRTARYYHSLFAARFEIPNIDLTESNVNTPRDFSCSPSGRLRFRKFSG